MPLHEQYFKPIEQSFQVHTSYVTLCCSGTPEVGDLFWTTSITYGFKKWRINIVDNGMLHCTMYEDESIQECFYLQA